MSTATEEREPDPLTKAERCLALADRAETPAERAALLGAVDATLAPVRARLRALDVALRARQGQAEPIGGEDTAS